MNDIKELTREEVITYMKAKGTGIDSKGNLEEEVVNWWLTEPKRREQIIECVRNNYDLIDFDEWQHLQDVLFPCENITISAKTAGIICNALYEEDIEVLELSRTC